MKISSLSEVSALTETLAKICAITVNFICMEISNVQRSLNIVAETVNCFPRKH